MLKDVKQKITNKLKTWNSNHILNLVPKLYIYRERESERTTALYTQQSPGIAARKTAFWALPKAHTSQGWGSLLNNLHPKHLTWENLWCF